MDSFIDKVECSRDNVFNTFENYDNAHAVGADLMKETGTFARSSFDFDKPIRLKRLYFSQVTSKQERVNRTLENICLLKYPTTLEELLRINDPNKFCFVQAMDIEAVNSETVNIHYTAHQSWEQEGCVTRNC